MSGKLLRYMSKRQIGNNEGVLYIILNQICRIGIKEYNIMTDFYMVY